MGGSAAVFGGLFVFAVGLLAQQQDLYQRLREAPLAGGQGAVLAEAARRRDFRYVERALAGVKAANRAEHAELLALQGAVEFVAGEMEPANSSFLEAEKLAPLGDADSFTLAMAEIKLQQGAAARTRLEGLARRYPASTLYLYWLGKLDYDQRRYDDGIAKMQRVIEADPQSVRAYNSLGLAFDMQGKFEAAQEALNKAAMLNRSAAHPSPWPPHDLGYLLLRMNQLPAAEGVLREALRYDNNFAEAHYHLARTLEKEGTIDAAVSEYEIAIALDKASAEPCYSLGQLYRKLKRDADAERMFAEYRKRKADGAP